MMDTERKKTAMIITIFAVAMAFLESAIVVYLRRIYYENGFSFPLRGFIEPHVLTIEWLREAFTIIMLVSIALLAAKRGKDRFAWFIYAFAIWDIFYYVWLKVLLDWPASFLTTDLLFLIPWPWVGPVLAPLISSVTLIALAYVLLKKRLMMNRHELATFGIGAAIILFTFLVDYGRLIFVGGYAKDFFTLATNASFSAAVASFTPAPYLWPAFAIGEVLLAASVAKYLQRKN